MPRQTDTPLEQRVDSLLFILSPTRATPGRAVLIVTTAVFVLGVIVGALDRVVIGRLWGSLVGGPIRHPCLEGIAGVIDRLRR